MLHPRAWVPVLAAKLREGVQWLERYPSFKLGLDNEAWTYGQPLSTFIGGESNIRQVAYALRAVRQHLGVTPACT